MGVLYKLLAEWTGEYSLMFLVEVATQFSKSWDPVSNQTCPFSHALPDLSSKILTRLQPWLLKITLGLRTRYLFLLINNDNDFEVAHPQSVSSSTLFLIELEFGNVGLWGEGKTGVPGEKALGAKEKTNNKLNPHVASTPGFEPWPHWWKAKIYFARVRGAYKTLGCRKRPCYCCGRILSLLAWYWAT